MREVVQGVVAALALLNDEGLQAWACYYATGLTTAVVVGRDVHWTTAVVQARALAWVASGAATGNDVRDCAGDDSTTVQDPLIEAWRALGGYVAEAHRWHPQVDLG